MGLTSAKKTDTNTYELEVSISPEDFNKGIDAAYRKEVKKITIPGFRKGKAPKAMIEKMYGPEVFFEEAVNSLYPQSYADAVEEAGIEPVSRAEVEVLSMSKEDGVVFKATVTVKPEVELEKYKGLEATKKVTEVTEEIIDGEIKKLQERNGRMVPVEGRPAENGDTADIDFEGFVDGVAFDGGKGEGYPLELGSHTFIDNFEDQIVGHNVGDEFEVQVTFPEEYHAEELKGKAATFKVKLNALTKKELPEVDDEFVKDVSEFDTLAELREDIRKTQTEGYNKAADNKVESDLIDALLANMKVELPQVMVENKIDDLIFEFSQRLQMQGLDIDTYLKYTGLDRDGFRKSFAEQAERNVRLRLALEKIVELENLTVSEEELNAEYEKLAKDYNRSVEEIKALLPTKDLEMDLKVNKAIDLVKDTAAITEEKA